MPAPLVASADWSALQGAVNARQATILTGASPVAGWKAFSSAWTSEALAAAVGGEVEYERSTLNHFSGYETDAHDAKDFDPSENRANDASKRVRGTMREFVSRATINGSHYSYLTTPLDSLGPALARDMSPLDGLALRDEALAPEDSAFTSSDLLRRASLWAGGANVTTQCHYDLFHNVIVQVLGRKRFTLFPPRAAESLYLHGYLSPRFRKSQVPLPSDFSSWNSWSSSASSGLSADALSRFPKAAHALKLAVSVELGPGDALYIPPFMLHHVQALAGGGEGGAAEGGGASEAAQRAASALSVSVNLFSPSIEIDLLERMTILAVPFEEAWLKEPRMLKAATAHWLQVALAACLDGPQRPPPRVGSRPDEESGVGPFLAEVQEGFGGAPTGLVQAMEDFGHDAADGCGDEGPTSKIAAILERHADAFRRRAAELHGLTRQIPGVDEAARTAVARQALRRYTEAALFNFVGGGTDSARRFVRYCLQHAASGSSTEAQEEFAKVAVSGNGIAQQRFGA